MQGLLLMPSKARPQKFECWKDVWKHWDSWLKQTNQTSLGATLRFALSIEEIDKLIVGVQSYCSFLKQCYTVKNRLLHPPVFTQDENFSYQKME